jgi:hypothetical protein
MSDVVPRGEAQTRMDQFYGTLESMPKLIGDLALSVAEGQRRLDQDYIEALTAFAQIASNLIGTDPDAVNKFMTLFKAMGPSRYQFTETVVEVRADLQMSTMDSLTVGATIGFPAPVAVAINASYTRRSAYDYQAAALVRTVLNAIPSDSALMATLLQRAGEVPHATLPSSDRYKALWESFGQLLQVVSSPPH